MSSLERLRSWWSTFKKNSECVHILHYSLLSPATRCGGDIVTLSRFRPSVRPCANPSMRGPCEHNRDYTVACFSVKLGRHVNHDERMNPIDFGGQKIKVTKDIYGNKLVNTIETKPLCISLSNLVDMLSMVRGWPILIVEVRNQRSRSQWTCIEIILWTRQRLNCSVLLYQTWQKC